MIMAAGETITRSSYSRASGAGFVICASCAAVGAAVAAVAAALAAVATAAAVATRRAYDADEERRAKCEVTNGGACISDLNYGNAKRCTFGGDHQRERDHV